MNEAAGKTLSRDDDHLKLLSLFYYILGGINAFYALIPLIHITIGILLTVLTPFLPRKSGEPPMAIFGILLIFIGCFVIIVILCFAFLKIFAGYCIAKRKYRAFIYVAAALSCLSFPYGLVLGVFTFIVFSRESVTAQFAPPGGEAA